MIKALSPIVAAVLALSSLSASAAGSFNEFTINETVIPGSVANANPALVADKLNGGFTERLTFTSPTTFSAQAFASFGQLFANDGTTLLTSLLNNFEPNGYRMYAVFSAVGTFNGGLFSSTSNKFDLFIDTNSNTSGVVTDGINAPTLSGNGDDIKLGSAGYTGATFGNGDLSSAPGAFNIDFTDFVLTAAGMGYFSSPNPFHTFVRINGDNDKSEAVPGGIEVTGDVSAIFLKVPEPASLALVGLALAGLGFSQRRKSA